MTLSRHAYCRRLGIDVWTRRRRGTATTAPAMARSRRSTPRPTTPAAPTAKQAPRQASQRPIDQPKRSARQTSTERPAPQPQRQAPASEPFRLRCFHYGRVFVAIAEDAWPRRRLLLDAAHAMNGFAPAERQDIAFDWPLPGAAADGAERAFRAFFGHQTRDGKRAIVAGPRVAELLGHDAPKQAALLDGHVYLPPQAPDAAAKQALWRLIQKP